jgi:O-antigen ligase
LKILVVVFLTIFVFSSLAALYVMVVNFTHPDWLRLPLTHLAYFPLNMRTDTFGILSFLVAAVSFLLLGITSIMIGEKED